MFWRWLSDKQSSAYRLFQKRVADADDDGSTPAKPAPAPKAPRGSRFDRPVKAEPKRESAEVVSLHHSNWDLLRLWMFEAVATPSRRFKEEAGAPEGRWKPATTSAGLSIPLPVKLEPQEPGPVLKVGPVFFSFGFFFDAPGCAWRWRRQRTRPMTPALPSGRRPRRRARRNRRRSAAAGAPRPRRAPSPSPPSSPPSPPSASLVHLQRSQCHRHLLPPLRRRPAVGQIT